MLPMDDQIGVENIRKNLSPASVHKDIFTKEELEFLWKYAFRTENRPRMNRNGTVLIAGKNGELVEVFNYVKDKIINILGQEAEMSPSIGGNWFITPQQYGLHNDSIRKEDWEKTLKNTPYNSTDRKYTVWKNVLIPLWIGTHFDVEDGGQFIFFDQRHIDWATVYNAGNVTPNIASVYNICTDYSNLQFYNGDKQLIDKTKNLQPFDKDVHKKYINTPIERLQGLSLESAFDWIPGDMFIFDAVQLHASNSGSKDKGYKTWNSKMGLLFTFLKELDDDLLTKWKTKQEKNNAVYI